MSATESTTERGAQDHEIIHLGHSPDSDDAFMFYGLASGKVETDGLEFVHTLVDIQTLNDWAREGKLEVTAISVGAYPYVADKYAILSHGASMGDNYGPMVVTREPMEIAALRTKRILIPGTLTSAFLALRLCIGDFEYDIVPFDQIMPMVAEGKAEAGLIIHEGQLTHASLGLQAVLDLGKWWFTETSGLPLPLGVNAVRKDLGAAKMQQIARIQKETILYALAHRAEALEYAMRFARGLETATADQFVGMYVNDWTIDLGPRGEESIRLFLQRAYEGGYIPRQVEVEFVRASS
jgi:1,4-dihydroxy-6-naphthoate synthase